MIQVIEYKNKYTPSTHISSNIKVFTKHLLDTIKIEDYSSEPITLQFDIKTDSGKIVVIDKYLWVKAEEYFTLIQMINFSLDFVTEVKLSYLNCMEERGVDYIDYYNAKYEFIFGDAPELFPSCEADVVTPIPRGYNYEIKVEKNNNCK